LTYFNSELDFSAINLVISEIVLIIWTEHIAAICVTSIIFLYISTLHMKYNFRQIKDRMKQCIKSGNLFQLMNAIHKHKYYSDLTLQFNEVSKYALAGIYITCTPSINIFVYLTVYETNPYLRILYGLGLIAMFVVIFGVHYMSSSLCSAAHDFTGDLYSLLFRKWIPLQYKLKILTFIGRLCGPKIGFYCYNLFAFTNQAFYEYIAILFTNYLLLNALLFDN